MRTNFTKLRMIITTLIIFSIATTKTFAQVGTTFFPIGGLSTWSKDALNNLNFFGTIPVNSPPAQIATTFESLTNPNANVNDFTGLKLSFSAYISSDGAKNTSVVLANNANWGGQGIVIEINKFQITAIRNFDYADFANPVVSFTGTSAAAYQASVRQDQYNTFVIDVSNTGVISIIVNGVSYATTYQADVTVLQAPGATRFAVFTVPVSGFQFKNIKAEKGGVTKTFFTGVLSTRYAESVTDWTLSSGELNYGATPPFTNPAIVTTTFNGLTEVAPTGPLPAGSNDFTGLNLTFDAFVPAAGNISVVLSWNGIWGNAAGGRGAVITINKTDVTYQTSFTGSILSFENTSNYPSKLATGTATVGAYNSFTINVSSTSVVTVSVNGYTLPVTRTAATLTASAPNPRYAAFGTDFTGFKIKNIVASKGSNQNSPLPVTLVSYTATKKANGSQLNWETASESNNSHYLVYRSTDGANFKQIAKITGNNKASIYQYLDQSPASGDNYYKLVQFDFDGKFEELGIRAVNFELQVDNTVSIYPKPADDKLNLSFNRTFDSDISVKIFDLSGREVQKTIITAQKEAVNYVLDLDEKINSGIYIINISSGQYKHSERIIVK